MSVRDLFGGSTAAYVLPAALGTAGQQLTVASGTPPASTNGLQSLIFAGAFDQVGRIDLTFKEVGASSGPAAGASVTLHACNDLRVLVVEGVNGTVSPMTHNARLTTSRLPRGHAPRAATTSIVAMTSGDSHMPVALTVGTDGVLTIAPLAGQSWAKGAVHSIAPFTIAWVIPHADE